MKNRVLIVDDHPMLRIGLTHLINGEIDFVVCGEADDPASALIAVQTTRPDVVVLDISLKGGTSGLVALTDIRLQFPDLPIVILSMHDETMYGPIARAAGASGYV